MPFYTALPSDIQTELEKITGHQPIIEAVYDPGGLDILLTGNHALLEVGGISSRRNLDPDWFVRPDLSDVSLVFADPDDYFNPTNIDSPFYQCSAELYAAAAAGDSTIQLTGLERVEFKAWQNAVITDGTNSENITILSFTSASGSTYYHTITVKNTLKNTYGSGSRVYTTPAEGRTMAIRLRHSGCTALVTLWAGVILKAPECDLQERTATITLADARKNALDQPLLGAETGDSRLTLVIDGEEQDGSWWNDGSAGTFDRMAVDVEEDAPIGEWAAKFTGEYAFSLTGPDIETGKTGKRYPELIKYIGIPGKAGLPTVDGDHLFIPDMTNQLIYIYDITDKESPVLLGTADYGANNYSISITTAPIMIKIDGDLMLASGLSYSQLWDITDPTTPAYCARFYTAYVDAIDISGTTLVRSSDSAWWDIEIYDISTPASPALITTISGTAFQSTHGIHILSNGLLTWNAATVLKFYDISTPASPVLKASFATRGTYYRNGLEDGDFFYFCNATYDTFEIYHIADKDDIHLEGSVSGAGSPNYLDYVLNPIKIGNYILIYAMNDYSLGVIDVTDKANPTVVHSIAVTDSQFGMDSSTYGGAVKDEILYWGGYNGRRIGIYRICTHDADTFERSSLKIWFWAFGGTVVANDELTFYTALNFNGVTPVEALVDVLENNCGIPARKVDRSAYSGFGDIEAGKLWKTASAGDTSIRLAVDVPFPISNGETLEISEEGGDSEEITVGADVADTAKYPPYIDVTVSALAGNYSPSAIVTKKGTNAATDTARTYDEAHEYCLQQGFLIYLSIQTPMTRLQAIELIAKHADFAMTYADNWGVEKIHILKPREAAANPDLTSGTNILEPGASIETAEVINDFHVKYGYNPQTDAYLYELRYPGNVAVNKSFWQHGTIRSREIELPGFLEEAPARAIAARRFFLFENGLRFITVPLTYQGMISCPGDRYDLDADVGEFEIEIVGLVEMDPIGGIFTHLGIDRTFLKDFLLAGSGAGTQARIW